MNRVRTGLARPQVLTPLGRVTLWASILLLVVICLFILRELPQDDQPPAYVVMPLDHGRLPHCPEGYDRPRYRDPDVAECLRIDLKEAN